MTKTITDAFEPYIGTVEYNGIVKTIQEWFYGDLVKASWCATSCSFFADQVGPPASGFSTPSDIRRCGHRGRC